MSSIKLSITVAAQLAAKYPAAARKRIDKSVAAWIAADARRGITTLHVAIDDAAAMQACGVPALSGKATPVKIKRALDALCRKLAPDYVCLFGGHDIVPMFVVPNPSYAPGGDDDTDVPTDNPYACSTPYKPKDRKSYLMPDRVIGRIVDLDGDADPAWLVDYLQRVTAWKGKPASYYDEIYAVGCDEWKGASLACMQSLGLPASQLQLSPPAIDTSAAARGRLKRKLHMIKCHGAALDPRFYGQKGTAYPEALRSATLKARVGTGTLVGAMCCYGAQVYDPKDPAAQLAGEWPIASTYLRQGAVGFAGATRIAWVGLDQMMCADWIVTAYLKSALGGASLGRAMLEAKQDYAKWLASQGQQPDTADEKTLIEFVLLGDPALHPVAPTLVAPAASARGGARVAAAVPSALLQQERGQRRLVRAALAIDIRRELPERHAAPSMVAHARRIFDSVVALLGKGDAKLLDAGTAHVERLVSRSTIAPAPAARTVAAATIGAAAPTRVARGSRESLEYYWTARTQPNGVGGQAQIRLLKVETDTEGRVVRTRLLHSA